MQPDEAKPPLRFRKLRFAWSVFWGLACVLLIVLWVRSYYTYDVAYHGCSDKRGYIIESINGKIVFEYVGQPLILDSAYGTHLAATGEIITGGLSKGTNAGFRFWTGGS